MLYEFLRLIFWPLFTFVFRTEVKGRENVPKEGPVILAANHLSNWDPPFLATYIMRPVSYMAKEELFESAAFARAIKWCHAFPVKRGAADISAIKAALGVLKSGGCLGLFPEGTRSRSGELGRAEDGVSLIAAKSKAPVVPAAIVGTNEIFSKKQLFPKLKVIYGEPLIFDGRANDREKLSEFSRRIMAEIERMKELSRK